MTALSPDALSSLAVGPPVVIGYRDVDNSLLCGVGASHPGATPIYAGEAPEGDCVHCGVGLRELEPSWVAPLRARGVLDEALVHWHGIEPGTTTT